MRTTINIFWPNGPKNEIVWDNSIGLFNEKPIIFHGNPEKTFPRSHSKNGNNNVIKISFSEIDFPNVLIKKKAKPQKHDKKAGKPKNTSGVIHKKTPPPIIKALLSQ